MSARQLFRTGSTMGWMSGSGSLALAVLIGAAGLSSSASASLVTNDLSNVKCVNKVRTSCTASPLTANDLVQQMLGQGVTFSNAVVHGAPAAFGRFTTSPKDPTIIGFSDGIVLSTGYVSNVIGPNEFPDVTQVNFDGPHGDASLAALLPGYNLYDAAVIEFDFVPTVNSVSFQYVWASDEYNEYANGNFNDVFGFFLNGQNVAVMPGSHTPVSINNVNGGNPYGWDAHHPEYFRNNDLESGAGYINTEMDGMTVVFTATGQVVPNQNNHIKLAIADAGDALYDSNVFIKTNSFVAKCPCNGVPLNGICPIIDNCGKPNPPPVAVCSPRLVIADANCQGTAKVNGGSFDPDNETINCVQSPDAPYPLGTTKVTLTCTDAHGSGSCSTTVTVIDHSPPTVTCPANQTDECADDGANACFPPPQATDNCGATKVACSAFSCGFFGLGNDGVTCVATDGSGNTASCDFTISVVDTQPPVVVPNADANGVSAYLWPPNHKYWDITLADCIGSATDQCVGTLPLGQYAAFVKGYSDEVEETGQGGDGHTCNDILFTGKGSVQLRSERQGGNTHSGRVYHLAYEVNDGHGNVTPGTCVVDVSHDQSGRTTPAIDSCQNGGPGPSCDPIFPHAGAFCVPGPGQSPAVCKGYGALHDPNCNF